LLCVDSVSAAARVAAADKAENLLRCEAQLDRQMYLPSFQTLCSSVRREVCRRRAWSLVHRTGFVNIFSFSVRREVFQGRGSEYMHDNGLLNNYSFFYATECS